MENKLGYTKNEWEWYVSLIEKIPNAFLIYVTEYGVEENNLMFLSFTFEEVYNRINEILLDFNDNIKYKIVFDSDNFDKDINFKINSGDLTGEYDKTVVIYNKKLRYYSPVNFKTKIKLLYIYPNSNFISIDKSFYDKDLSDLDSKEYLKELFNSLKIKNPRNFKNNFNKVLTN